MKKSLTMKQTICSEHSLRQSGQEPFDQRRQTLGTQAQLQSDTDSLMIPKGTLYDILRLFLKQEKPAATLQKLT